MVRRLEILSAISSKWYGDYKRVRDIYISAATRIKGSIRIKELENVQKTSRTEFAMWITDMLPYYCRKNW